MSNDRTYNGWYNYETWLANLWIQNDEALYAALHADVVAADSISEAFHVLTSWLNNEFDLFREAAAAGERTGLFIDLLHVALGHINWHEIVKNWRNEE